MLTPRLFQAGGVSLVLTRSTAATTVAQLSRSGHKQRLTKNPRKQRTTMHNDNSRTSTSSFNRPHEPQIAFVGAVVPHDVIADRTQKRPFWDNSAYIILRTTCLPVFHMCQNRLLFLPHVIVDKIHTSIKKNALPVEEEEVNERRAGVRGTEGEAKHRVRHAEDGAGV